MYFRKWSYVPASVLEDVEVTLLNEDGQDIVLSSTDQYIPWWLTDNRNMPPINEFLPPDCFLEDELVETNDLPQPVNETINSLDVFDQSSIDLSWDNNHNTIEGFQHPQANSTLMGSSVHSISALSASLEMSIEQNNALRVIQNFVDEISLRDLYFADRFTERERLGKLFEDAATKTALEQLNLENKEIRDGRYVNLFARLSLNSRNVCEEAMAARDLYTKSVQQYNDSNKKQPEIKVTPDIKKAFETLSNSNFPTKSEENFPLYLTKRDFADSEKYLQIFSDLRDKS